MQVSVENTSALGRRVQVSLPSQVFKDSYQKRVRDVAKNANLAGFRRGKVPAQIVEQRYGAQLRSETAMDLVRENLGKALDEHKLRVAGTPSVNFDSDSKGPEFQFEATFEVLPDFGQIDVSTLPIRRENAEVSDADIDQMIENLRLQRRTWNEGEGAAAVGDLVTFEFHAEVDGKRIPAEGRERGGAVIGAGTVLKEIEVALTGIRAGETRSFSLSYPTDVPDANIAGKTAQAEITATHVKVPVLPEVNADFIESFGVEGGELDNFRKEIRGNLERELRNALSARLRSNVVEKLVEANSGFDLPVSLVEREAEALREQAIANAKRQGAKITEQPSLEPFMDAARHRTRAGLLLDSIAAQNNITLKQERVVDALSAIASTYEDPSEVLRLYQSNENMLGALRARVMEEQVAEWIADHAQTEIVQTTFAEVVRTSRG